MNAGGRGKQRIGDRRPGNPSLPFRPIVGVRKARIRRRQIGTGFTRIFVVPAGFRVGLGDGSRPALNTNCRKENENENWHDTGRES